MINHDTRVRDGFWLYDGTVPSGVEVWRRGFRPGTGDEEDDPEYRDDQIGEWYEVVYQQPGRVGGSAAGGAGYYRDLPSALEAVRVATRNTVHWNDT
jgi:hypothetical protein